MALERILYLVTATNRSNAQSNEDFDINDAKCILGISQALSSLLHDPKKQKTKNRQLYMKFIKEFCLRKSDHFTIAEDSCNVYLDSLQFPEDEFDKDSYFEFAEPNEILNFFENQLNKHENKQLAIEFINKKDQEAFGQDFDFTPFKTIEYHAENTKLSSNLITRKDVSIENFNFLDDLSSRQKRVDFAYAVMNLKLPNANKIFRSLMEQWKCLSLMAFEKKIIKMYYSENRVNGAEFIESFKFVYEEPLIEIATLLVNREMIDYGTDKKVIYVKTLMENYPCAKVDIPNILSELFVLSNYQHDVYNLMKYFTQLCFQCS